MRRASSPTILDDNVNRIPGDFGDPKDMVAFLNGLQQKVSEGIEEICGLSGGDLTSNRIEETKTPPKSLFNQELVQ